MFYQVTREFQRVYLDLPSPVFSSYNWCSSQIGYDLTTRVLDIGNSSVHSSPFCEEMISEFLLPNGNGWISIGNFVTKVKVLHRIGQSRVINGIVGYDETFECTRGDNNWMEWIIVTSLNIFPRHRNANHNQNQHFPPFHEPSSQTSALDRHIAALDRHYRTVMPWQATLARRNRLNDRQHIINATYSPTIPDTPVPVPTWPSLPLRKGSNWSWGFSTKSWVSKIETIFIAEAIHLNLWLVQWA